MIIIGIINLMLILITAGILFWYMWETRQLRLLSARPVLKIMNSKSNGSFYIKNIGKGPALNIELRICQVHKNGGRTNLRDLLENEKQRHLINLGENETVDTKGEGTVHNYIEANSSEFVHGKKRVFEIVSIYNGIYGNEYFTVALFKVVGEDYILKKTFIDEFTGNNLPVVNDLDWLS